MPDNNTNLDPEKQAQIVHLRPFEEIRGQFHALEINEEMLYVLLSTGTLRFPVDSPEARMCTRALEDREGARIAMLRTPSEQASLYISTLSDIPQETDP